MRERWFAFALFAIAALTAVPHAFAQTEPPHADWQTFETKHFRFHFPREYEEWARLAASRLESARERVIDLVGYEPPERIDVIVSDPAASANGAALPILGWPRMLLWTTPPPPGSVIGSYRDWIDILTIHEQTHLVHILRPSRNPARRLLQTLLPLGPIGFAPRWVSEGYATVIEGELTGSGRPASAIRASIIRTWARAGRMPSYSQINSDSTNWMGMSMAYLVGSAYLEWLRERAGAESLRTLWRRMTARRARSFDDAFTGTFGDSPQRLYARFVAEVTRQALEAEARVAPSAREGELWQDLRWSTAPPDVSRDGTLLASVLRSREGPSRLVVWTTGPNQAEEKEKKRIERMLRRDPEDVAPVRLRPLRREPKYELVTRNRIEPIAPRFTRDDRAVIFASLQPDPDGMLHSDLFRWTLETGNLERLSVEADLHDPDPSPGGELITAVRHRHGKSQLVTYAPSTGEVSELTSAAVDRVYAAPRWSPAGDRLAYVMHSGGRWRLMIRELASGVERELPTLDALIASPAWAPDGASIYVTIGRGGFLEIHQVPANGRGEPRQVTRSHTASTAPAVDGQYVYFLGLDPEGFDLRRIALVPPVALGDLPPMTDLGVVAARPPEAEPQPLERRPLPPSRPYGAGRPEFLLLTGGNHTPANDNFEIGVRIGDLVGRSDVVVTGAIAGDGGQQGGAISGTWRGWPVEVGAHLFSVEQDLSRQPGCRSGLACAGLRSGERRGVELNSARTWVGAVSEVRLRAGVSWQRVEMRSETGESLESAFLIGGYERTPTFGKLKIPAAATVRADLVSYESTATFVHASVRSGLAYGRSSLTAHYRRAETDDATFLLGGEETTLLPSTVTPERIDSDGLPVATLSGRDYESSRADLQLSFLPLTLFYERHRFRDVAREWLDVAGAEITVESPPVPLVRLPAILLSLGAARVLHAPLEKENVWWIRTVWRP